MAENARLLNFYFSTGNFKTYSTVRYLGMLDNNNTISDNDVYYRDIQDKFEPDPDTYFEVRGGIRLGFRQLDNARWPASPLYTLRIKNPKLAQQLSQEDSVLHIKLGEERGASSHNNDNKSEKLRIEEMELINGKGGVNKSGLSFKLNTLADSGIGETSYWLDSGSVLGK